MKQAIRLIDTNTAIVFYGGYLGRKYFDEIVDKIKSVPTEEKCDWLIKFLEERNFHIVDICSNAARFPDSSNTIII